jgi:sec-independent protein translocase protein TatA
MLGNLGGGELILVLVIALLVLGAKRLPDAGRVVGKGLRDMRRAISEAQDAVMGDSLDELRGPLRPLRPPPPTPPPPSPPSPPAPPASSATPAGPPAPPSAPPSPDSGQQQGGRTGKPNP